MELKAELESIKSEIFLKKLKLITSQENIENRIHYYSLINVCEGILNEYESNTVIQLKKNLCEYIFILKGINSPVDKFDSIKYFKKYIHPSGYQLERKSKIYSNYKFHLNIYVGLILDIILNFFLFKLGFKFIIPFFLVVFTFRGQRAKVRAKKKNKYYSQGY